MTDRELLELAAKAAGLLLHDGTHVWVEGAGQWARWNPLTDDGDALRLAVALDLSIQLRPLTVEVLSWPGITGTPPSVKSEEPYNNDALAATRRAIVRAAAEIGRQA